jgi:hypothetical protein
LIWMSLFPPLLCTLTSFLKIQHTNKEIRICSPSYWMTFGLQAGFGEWDQFMNLCGKIMVLGNSPCKGTTSWLNIYIYIFVSHCLRRLWWIGPQVAMTPHVWYLCLWIAPPLECYLRPASNQCNVQRSCAHGCMRAQHAPCHHLSLSLSLSLSVSLSLFLSGSCWRGKPHETYICEGNEYCQPSEERRSSSFPSQVSGGTQSWVGTVTAVLAGNLDKRCSHSWLSQLWDYKCVVLGC